MGSNVLHHSLVSLPSLPPLPHSQTQRFTPFASSSRHLAISRPHPSRFGPSILIPILTRRHQSTFSASAAEGEVAVENDTEEEEPDAIEEAKPLRKPIIKLGDVMGILNRRAVEASEKERPVPDIRTGDVVEIKLEVPENRRRLSNYKGIVISRQNAGIHTTIRIRRIIAGIGVEIVFPLYSPNIKEIKVVSHRKVRRARLYYLRDKLPRLSTFK